MRKSIRQNKLCLVFLLAFFLVGCGALTPTNSNPNYEQPSGGTTSTTSTTGDAASQASDYYYADFDDVPIPRQMSLGDQSNIIYTPGGVKTGQQVFSGRVELSSLNKFMINSLQRDGWTLRSGQRISKRAILVFDKPDRFCIIYVQDGSFNTTMDVSVTPKLPQADGQSRSSAASPVSASSVVHSLSN